MMKTSENIYFRKTFSCSNDPTQIAFSDLNETYRLDFLPENIQGERSYIAHPADRDQITTKQRNQCVLEWLEGVEKKEYFLSTI